MYDDSAYKRFCERMAEVHLALKACEHEVDNIADDCRRQVEAAIATTNDRTSAKRFALAEVLATGTTQFHASYNDVAEARAALDVHPRKADLLIFDCFTLQEVK